MAPNYDPQISKPLLLLLRLPPCSRPIRPVVSSQHSSVVFVVYFGKRHKHWDNSARVSFICLKFSAKEVYLVFRFAPHSQWAVNQQNQQRKSSSVFNEVSLTYSNENGKIKPYWLLYMHLHQCLYQTWWMLIKSDWTEKHLHNAARL